MTTHKSLTFFAWRNVGFNWHFWPSNIMKLFSFKYTIELNLKADWKRPGSHSHPPIYQQPLTELWRCSASLPLVQLLFSTVIASTLKRKQVTYIVKSWMMNTELLSLSEEQCYSCCCFICLVKSVGRRKKCGSSTGIQTSDLRSSSKEPQRL